MTKRTKQLLLHLGLFVLTLIATTLAGTEWMYSKYLFWVEEDVRMTWQDFFGGLHFSLPFLLILTVHEFGHYFTARYHKINVTLPYYIPMWLGFILAPSFGTMGAFIKIKDRIYSLKHYFDVGVSGPLAGFVIALGVIWYGFTHLPEPEYIYQIHPEYEQYGANYADHVYEEEGMVTFRFGDNIIYWFFENYVADPERMPHPNEIIHYPYLLAGYLALFFTALNLLPIGQLDGGHILFGLLGAKNHWKVSQALFTIFVFYAGLGVVSIADLPSTGTGDMLNYLLLMGAYIYFLYACTHSMFPAKQSRWLFATVIFTAQFVVHTAFDITGYSGWMLFALMLGRFLGIQHPPVIDRTPLSSGRKVLGWIALIVFILSFSPEPFILEFE
ncbi:site-2 protease family protein [Marinoscillum furvescens]|uniref:Peptidase M50-like protein n=1 Tax=Marinoscillum furvescens DSM 4134 TaxID=1122208 RepID=A0A3D9L1Q8_MARFU|nr:site-2 protease family protein [Marinoscillum furvescens]RED96163.1 peptidase M50-like protein [Marinoscillum furvescens DSM 4134]